jgi:hypothetical protein
MRRSDSPKRGVGASLARKVDEEGAIESVPCDRRRDGTRSVPRLCAAAVPPRLQDVGRGCGRRSLATAGVVPPDGVEARREYDIVLSATIG